MTHQCYACRLTHEDESCPGGTLLATERWVVQHCTGPFPVGTLIVKPVRHLVHLSELTPDEASELGPLLPRLCGIVQALTRADQVYVCSWSHRDWIPNHVHFVVQPAWSSQRERFSKPGPSLQAQMLEVGETPSPADVVAWCEDARRLLGASAADSPVIH